MFYYSFKRIPVKTSSNTLSLILIDIKFWSSFACFTASSGYEGMFSVADILHIADVIRQVYSCCSCYAFRQQFSYFFFMKCVKCHFLLVYKTKQPYPQDFLFAILFSGNYPVLFDVMSRISQTSFKFGYEGLAKRIWVNQKCRNIYLMNEW